MNDTNLTQRQNFISNFVNQNNGVDRDRIQSEATKTYKISKPTLIRDLNLLIVKKLIRVEGKGKNTLYFPATKNLLLRPFDLVAYFQKEADSRVGVKKSFDFSVFGNLKNLFTASEKEKVRQIQRSFSSQSKRLSSDILARELERFVIELAWKSSKIEGNTYTLLETETLIKESIEAKNKTKAEATMILNHKFAFEQILAHKQESKKLSLSLVNQLHQTLTKDLGITPGVRKHAVGITGTAYQPLDNQHQIHEAMEKLIAAINTNPEPLEKALIASAMLAYIQPFADGNKRTARMLTNAILIAHDHYPLSYRSVDENELKQALILFYEQNSLYHLKLLFIEQLLFAYRTYFQ